MGRVLLNKTLEMYHHIKYKCSSDVYMIPLYCLVVQAGFYSNMVECWPVMQTAQV